MTLEKEIGLNESSLPSPDGVAQYLQTHPEFFSTFPALLTDLVIPHPTGEAVSLFERQVSALREENERLKKRFDDVLRLAAKNHELNIRIHQLALDLMRAVGPQAIFATLEQRLRSGFDADRVVTLVFGQRRFDDGSEMAQFAGRETASREPFRAILSEHKTLCGRLTQVQNATLFGDVRTPGSTVVLPLLGNTWDGVLAINSSDEARFDQNMGTDFLTYLGDITTLVLDPWIAKTGQD